MDTRLQEEKYPVVVVIFVAEPKHELKASLQVARFHASLYELDHK